MMAPVVLVVGSGASALEAVREVVRQGGMATLVRDGSMLRQCALRTPGGFDVVDAELLAIDGSPGRFTARLSSDGEEMVLECSAIVLAPERERRPAAPGTASLEEVEDRKVCRDPRSVAFVLWPGTSRSAFIRAVAAARGLRAGPRRPQTVVFAPEMAAYGVDELIYRQAQDEGVIFVRSDEPEVIAAPPLVVALDHITEQIIEVRPDLLVVEEPSTLTGEVRVPPAGFTVLMGPPSRGVVSTMREGIATPGPEEERLDGETVTGARAAATRALTLAKFPPNRHPWAAIVDRDKCAACLTCARVCPFGAARPGEEGKATIDGALCQACGICVGACPGRALSLPNYGGVPEVGNTLMEARQ
ncbi:MAG: 4Fe-4S binding protein [Methanomassiliicoccus sp.]|nr:4Fe-4S binding protein [Methanomassiliicoccus sp.]